MLLENATMQCTEEVMGPKRDSLYIVVPIIAAYVVIFITGTVGNVSTCIVISRNKSMHTATNYYLFSLAISDLVLLLSGIPQEIYLIYSRYPYVLGSTFLLPERDVRRDVGPTPPCSPSRPSPWSATWPSATPSSRTPCRSCPEPSSSSWPSGLVALGLAVPQAMQQQLVGPPNCKVCTSAILKYSFEVSTLLFFVLPMSMITVLYVLIGRKLKSSTMMKKRNVLGNSNARIQNKSSRKVVKMLGECGQTNRSAVPLRRI
jgi:neuromedin U receptor 1